MQIGNYVTTMFIYSHLTTPTRSGQMVQKSKLLETLQTSVNKQLLDEAFVISRIIKVEEDSHLLVSKLHSGTSKTMQLVPVHLGPTSTN